MSNQHYIFTPHKSSNPQLRSWDKSKVIGPEEINQMRDTVAKRSGAKAATSVPSPFARMHLFKTAFEITSSTTRDNPRPQEGDSMYHRLVSDCLDVFQFLFNATDAEELSYKVWSKTAELEALRSASKPATHKLLATSLQMEMDKGDFRSMNDIILIFYKNKLLGSSSPYTVFATSPNWVREMQKNNWVLTSTTSDNYFDDTITGLKDRDIEFQRFIVKLYQKNIDLMYSQFPALAKYIDYYLKTYGNPMEGVHYDYATFDNEYEPIPIGQNLWLNVCGLMCYRRKAADVSFAIERDSSFVIQPTVKYYKTFKDEATGADITIPEPLVLVNGFNQPGVTYIKGPWNPETPVPDTLAEPLQQRRLPGNNNIQYPYLVVGDFLSENLIEMPFDLNEEYFYTGYNGRFNFLLPIKKAYFNYFTLQDLRNNLTVARANVGGVEKVMIDLKIPIRNNRAIIFHKEYVVAKDQGRFRDERFATSARFGMGVFPFYQITDNTALNDYVLMLVDKDARNVSLKFYRNEDVILNKELPYKATARIQKQLPNRAGSIYYRLKGTTFDFIEVGIEGYTGLIIPEWGQRYRVSANTGVNNFTFAVDFGTSNTHVAYKNQNISVTGLDIKPDELQVVMLNKSGDDASPAKRFNFGWGLLPDAGVFKRREFMPSVIGVQDAETVYPIRTAVCEGTAFRAGSEADLFTNINIGFYLDSDAGLEMKDAFYEVNIKWGLENNKESGPARERVEAFILQTLWMIKNKILLGQGRLDQTKIVWFLPISMGRMDKRAFREIWATCMKDVFGNIPIQLTEETESAAPYFYLRQAQGFYYSQNAVNIDIGGGTTDILFIVQKQNRQISTSFRFAANDIWGDGFSQIPNSNGGPKDNGFVLLMDSKIQRNELQLPDDLRQSFQGFMQSSNFSSSDVVSFMFKNDKSFNFSGTLQNHPLKSVLLLHFAGIVYHIGQLADMLDIDIPLYLIFTGNGSKYIHILGETDMQDFAAMILSKATQKPVPTAFKLLIAPNPKEATANGGVVKADTNNQYADGNTPKPEEWEHPGFVLDAAEKEAILNNSKDYTLGESGEMISRVLDNFDKFLDVMFNDREIKGFMEEIGLKLRAEDRAFLREKAELSFEEMSHRLRAKQGDESSVPESMFFWCLKDTLYKYSKKLYNK